MIAQSTVTLIIVGLAGLFIGLLVSGLFANRDAKSKGSTRLTPEMQKEGYSEVARLWYSPTSRSIMPELDGEFITPNTSLLPDQQKKLFRISDLLAEWVKKLPPPAAQPEVQSVEPVSNPPANVPAPELTESQPSPFIETLPEESFSPPSAAFTPPVINEPEVFSEIGTSDEEEEQLVIKPRTIAGQISMILDDMIKSTSLRDKGIKLIEREDHGVDVWIGMEKFDGVESIPYPEAKQLIKAAAARWEKEASLRGKLGAD